MALLAPTTTIQLPRCSLTGRSRAGDATSWRLEPMGWNFDAGCIVNLAPTKAVFLTHTHADHVQALPQLVLQNGNRNQPTPIYVPARAEPLLERFLQSFQALIQCDGKDDDERLVLRYQLHSIEAGDNVLLRHGGIDYEINVVACDHRVDCVGFSIFSVQQKLKTEYQALSGSEIGQLRRQGVAVTTPVRGPVLAILGDTTPRVFDAHPKLLLQHNVVLMECTYLDEADTAKAQLRRHTCWSELAPIVRENINVTFLLAHVTLKCSAARVFEFFDNLGLDNVHVLLHDDVDNSNHHLVEPQTMDRNRTCLCRLCRLE